MKLNLTPGETLFREGDPSETAFLITSGTVTVLKRLDGDEVVLGTVSEGEFLGEMGVLEAMPRSATAVAETAVEATVFDRAAFLSRIASDGEVALSLLRRLSHRLRDMNQKVAALSGDAHGEPAQDAAESPERAIFVQGSSLALQFYIGGDPIEVEKLPFSVGRSADVGEVPRAGGPDLGVPDPMPHRLSPKHFELYQDHDGLWIKDCASELGTIVNGISLGHDFPVDRIKLEIGENHVVAGGRASPYEFTVTVA